MLIRDVEVVEEVQQLVSSSFARLEAKDEVRERSPCSTKPVRCQTFVLVTIFGYGEASMAGNCSLATPSPYRFVNEVVEAGPEVVDDVSDSEIELLGDSSEDVVVLAEVT